MSVEIWFDERDDAEAFLEELQREADVRRVGFAGEEDDEDHAWVVLLPAADQAVVYLADSHGGWVPEPVAPPAATAPMDLPRAPRRLKDARGHSPSGRR
ncbi:hypothetical protein D9V41_10085 [Aeromicrobium phragmitis]|uniref:Uncharacterized protein n=1 Tax=Aeromicrobium phragmitis TaxID=2478914 RepID=A0A3L8PK92_9ACTN|nr:hypothetical protein [Aeromicrobium phragmitis]RLV55795.1 hypothetical protein D9V41_10085 [Aeromicrobium phragmitis]